jgi:hypothetical protein
LKLVIRPRMSDRESLRGYVLRVAECNGYPDQRYLLHLCGLRLSYQLKFCDLTRLSEVTDGQLIDLEKASYWVEPDHRFNRFGAAEVASSALSLSGAKVCLGCLSQTGCTDRLWDLQYYVWCHRHRMLLVDRCSDCRKRLVWFRASLARCQCGALLHQVDNSLSKTQCSHLQFICEQIAALEVAANPPDCDWPDLAQELRPNSLAPYLSLLDLFGNPAKHASWRTKAREKPEISNQLYRVIAAGEAMADWPRSLEAWLDARRASNTGRPAPSLTLEFGRHLYSVRKICRKFPAISSFRKAVRLALRESPRQRVPLKWTSKDSFSARAS